MSNINYIEESLIAVYENECNYNALMKAVGISELRYYSETGKDLFINESNAFNNFIDKAKEFFKKIIDKIKELFNKFKKAVISALESNNNFLDKYKDELDAMKKDQIELENVDPFIGLERSDEMIGRILDFIDADNLNKITDGKTDNISIDEYRGDILGISKSIPVNEFAKACRDKIYGTKLNIKTTVEAEIKVLKSLKDDMQKLTNQQDKIINQLNQYIKQIDSAKGKNTEPDTMRSLNVSINAAKQFTACTNTLFGVLMAATKDRNLQAKRALIDAIKNNNHHKTNTSPQQSPKLLDVKNEFTLFDFEIV